MSERDPRPKGVRNPSGVRPVPDPFPPPTTIGQVCAKLGLALEDVERWSVAGGDYLVIEKGGIEHRLAIDGAGQALVLPSAALPEPCIAPSREQSGPAPEPASPDQQATEHKEG